MIRKTHVVNSSAVAIIIAVMFSVSSAQQVNESDPVSQIIHYITVQPDISLEVIEWGGEGEPLVFLAGLGHTAHVFDEFAPRFTDDFRVLGITRRGFGASSQPAAGYDIATLADDIRIVLDKLQIKRAILVGHSLGGDEITRFASTYPDRVNRLIYLEAAYDRISTRDSLANYPDPEYVPPSPTDDDFASISAFQTYYENAQGVRWPESEVRALYALGPDEEIEGFITPGWIYGAVNEGLAHPDYSRISAPALAIYAVDYPITELFPDYATRDSSTQKEMRLRYEAGKRLDEMSRRAFLNEMGEGKVIELRGAGHSLYLTHADEVAEKMREFLSEH